MPTLEEQLATQRFANGYELVSGVLMHEENGDAFQIPPDVIKRHVREGQFVELRIDSPRFSVHTDSEVCLCPSCNGEMRKPILRHEHPATLLSLPDQDVPSRGWGEDFWVQITERNGRYLKATVDNALVESRLHEIQHGDEVFLHEDHILAVHGIHREELVLEMDAASLKELAEWLGSQQ
ncbi:MAG: hypothetical protein H8E37_11310 [Planctomycetes bacterium]|nr:hypothetical protein [Planctomycetota bacterium]